MRPTIASAVRRLALLLLSWPFFGPSFPASASDPVQGGGEFFEKRIRPLLSEKCYKCHSANAEKLKGGLMLDSREALLKGGDTGPGIVPGDVEKSLLVGAVRWTDQDLQMPPKHQLEPAQISDLEAWVKSGAAWPQGANDKAATKKIFDLQRRKQEHWCWQPVAEPALPEVRDRDWPLRPLDRFVLAKLEEKGLRPAAPAARRTLIRRASFDLCGLPPTPEEVEAFVQDPAPDAFARVVNRLLASPHFGERWARHWLDSVRYAESRGHEFDPDIPNAWQYRDYVVRALNEDVPYSVFAEEHIAGDLLGPRLDPKTGANESIIGTGFWFLGEEVHSPVDIRQDEADRMDNRLDVMGKTFLGLTVGCARCHDHKFDAISQRDYYALSGFLISSGYRQARFETLEQDRRIAGLLEELRGSARREILKAVADAERAGIDASADAMLSAASAIRGEPASFPTGETAARWVAELKSAMADPLHPLHLFAAVAEKVKGADPAEFARVFSPLVAAAEPGSASVRSIVPAEQVVVDFSERSASWIQDGFSFGLHPLHAGDPIFGSTPDQPLAGLATRGAAFRDSAWNALKVQSAARDFGRLGKWDRSEKTLRTPELTLAAPRLWYLVKGPGHAWAAVNSHELVNGPLHGGVFRDWAADGGEWRWVEHGLADYQGHRMHVEFFPDGGAELAVAAVVQSNERPPLPGRANPALRAAVLSANVDSLGALARTTQATLATAAARIGQDEIAGSADAAEAAELADWTVRKLDLFCPPGSPERRQLQEASLSFVSRQADLIGRIRSDSHTAPAMFDGSGADECVLVRGQAKSPGERVPRRFLEAIAGPEQPPIAAGSGRLELARRITDPANPLTARVAVNRVWHHLFGRGIVATVDNFGVLGERPSNQELLDHLAAQFTREQGWSMKRCIREIVLSRTYQMASEPCDATAEQADPQNLLVHRMNVRRLEGEAIRDAILGVSGRLDEQVGGPSVPVHLTAFMDGRGKPDRNGPLDGNGRRSIYQEIRRNFLSPMMLAFDTPIPFSAMGRRNVSNVPSQALILMNDPFVVEQARIWASRLPATLDPGERVRRMYLAAFSRPPTPEELAADADFLREQTALYGSANPAEPRAWADLAHVLFNVKEFIYLN